mmetsp:Transcript_14301/g.39579  ORF Transcript_14301/g.39579 Transcript_14301/m.39579 type:complete len:205 (-) Transcript_14301:433-1047(-)
MAEGPLGTGISRREGETEGVASTEAVISNAQHCLDSSALLKAHKKITMQLMLSLEPLASASSTSILARISAMDLPSASSCLAIGVSSRMLSVTSSTACWSLITSHTPSHAKMTKASWGERSVEVMSGTLLTTSFGNIGIFSKWSPRARVMASMPLTRSFMIKPPASMTRLPSSGSVALWSVMEVSRVALPPRDITARLSPRCAV